VLLSSIPMIALYQRRRTVHSLLYKKIYPLSLASSSPLPQKHKLPSKSEKKSEKHPSHNKNGHPSHKNSLHPSTTKMDRRNRHTSRGPFSVPAGSGLSTFSSYSSSHLGTTTSPAVTLSVGRHFGASLSRWQNCPYG